MSNTIQNIEQLRAANALKNKSYVQVHQDKREADALSGFPSLIINNGLLPALAFALEKKDGQLPRICNALATHLASVGRFENAKPNDNGQALQDWLIHTDSAILRLATEEILAFLSYLKRYARTSS